MRERSLIELLEISVKKKSAATVLLRTKTTAWFFTGMVQSKKTIAPGGISFVNKDSFGKGKSVQKDIGPACPNCIGKKI